MRGSHRVGAFALLGAAVCLAWPGWASADIVWSPKGGWQKAPSATGSPASPDFDKGFAAYVDGRYSRARGFLVKVADARQEPLAEQAKILIAECYLGEKHYTKSFEKFEEFIDAYPASAHLDRAFSGELEIAKAVLSGDKIKALGLRIWSGYSFGEKVVDKITSRRPLSDYARDAQLALAKSYFHRKMYLESASAFQQYLEFFGGSQAAPEALMGMGESLYRDAPGAACDPLPYYRAAAAFDDFLKQYPASAAATAAREFAGRARANLAEHYLLIAQYYLKVGKLEAAAKYFKKVSVEYADTPAAGTARSYMEALPPGQ